MDYALIKRLSKEKGLSLKDLSEGVGITAQGFHGYVKRNTMPINILEAIAVKLNIGVQELLGGDILEILVVSKENVLLFIENKALRKELNVYRQYFFRPIHKGKSIRFVVSN